MAPTCTPAWRATSASGQLLAVYTQSRVTTAWAGDPATTNARHASNTSIGRRLTGHPTTWAKGFRGIFPLTVAPGRRNSQPMRATIMAALVLSLLALAGKASAD